MLISLNWIRDFVDLPKDIDPRALAEKFTTTTAEVEGIEPVSCAATGLISGEVKSVQLYPGAINLYAAQVSDGSRERLCVTQAKGLAVGDRVIFAPPTAVLPGFGVIDVKNITIGNEAVQSIGMIVSGGGLGLTSIGENAVFLPPGTAPGTPIDMALFDDWVMAIDNKSITHRPDLWGHYGVARELAAIYGLRLRDYPVAALAELQRAELPEIPIEIDDPGKSPRYSALRFAGVRAQPAPLWMQLRLAHVGLRPIDILVDLTNYIMAELGQPTHAFDAAGIDRIEVAVAAPGEKFTTLDGVQRTMPAGALMIQSHRRSVALAGIMGGADTEIKAGTSELLLESANFEPATIRRAAAALGHRTDASARFEKSLDPANTVLAIQRFVHLARPELPGLRLTSRLSDAFPAPPRPVTVRIEPQFVARYIGREVPVERIISILTALQFGVRRTDGQLELTVPGFRATKDVSIPADVVEEVARFVGYGSIAPAPPVVTVRYAEPDAMAQLERRTLDLLCRGMSYAEIHQHIWFDDAWLGTLGYDPGPTIRLRNPAAAGQARLRTSLTPGLLAAVDRNRHHLDRFELLEIGSVFFSDQRAGRSSALDDLEQRHLGLALAIPGRKPAQEDELIRRIKIDLETWARQVLSANLNYAAESSAPWEHEARTAGVRIGQQVVGRLSIVPPACKRGIDEHLAAWTIAIAELDLSAVVGRPREEKKLIPVPVYPSTNVDFSVLAPAERRYAEIERRLAGYQHPLLRRLALVDSFEGGSIAVGQRSFTFRATIADPARTLTEKDIQDFRADFIAFLAANQLNLRS